MNKSYIITGPPGSGKSSLIEALEDRGYSCLHEVSRQVIKREQAYQNDGMPWGDIERFSQLVFKETIDKLSNDSAYTFCDRSLIDNIAYLHHANQDIPTDLSQFPFHQYYRTQVFFAAPWADIYQTDPQRPQPFEEQLSLSDHLIDVYESKGFELIFLPFDTIAERVSFVLKKVGLMKKAPNCQTELAI